MTDKRSEQGNDKTERVDVTADPQPTGDDHPPIPQPPTDGFPTGEEYLTSRVPGESKNLTGDEKNSAENS